MVRHNDLPGILAECAAAWYRSHCRVEPAFAVRKAMRTMIGAGICELCAAAACALFQGSGYEVMLPWGFLIVLLASAWFFGALAGILGSISAGVTFAVFLYPPVGIGVASHSARIALATMILATSVLSWFLTVSRHHRHLRTAKTAR